MIVVCIFMCYGYVDKVEIDFYNKNPEIVILSNDGNEYILQSTRSVPKYESNYKFNWEIHNRTITEKCNNPATYITISTDWSLCYMHHVKNIKLYGKAI